MTALRKIVPTSTSIAIVACCMSFSSSANALRCKAPSSQRIDQVRGYLAGLRHLDRSDLKLVTSTESSTKCYWKLQFELEATGLVITTYLSPNRQFLSSDVFDLKEDPLAEQRHRVNELSKALTAGDPPTRGSATAAVTIVEFADFECLYCGRFSQILEQDLKGDPSVRIEHRNFPLRMHPWANNAAEIAECAEMQDSASFWKVHDFLFSHQPELSVRNVGNMATAFVASNTDLDVSKFKSCIANHRSAALVKADVDLGLQNGVHATPTFFVNGVRYQGTKNAEQLKAILDAARRGEVWPVAVTATPQRRPTGSPNTAGGKSLPPVQ